MWRKRSVNLRRYAWPEAKRNDPSIWPEARSSSKAATLEHQRARPDTDHASYHHRRLVNERTLRGNRATLRSICCWGPVASPRFTDSYRILHTGNESRRQEKCLIGRLAYWQHQLAGVDPVLALPTDRDRPIVPTAPVRSRNECFRAHCGID